MNITKLPLEATEYLHLYLPFKAAIDYNPVKYPNAGMGIDMVMGIDLRFNRVYTSNGTDHELKQIKPLLRPLSDMTEAEGKVLGNVVLNRDTGETNCMSHQFAYLLSKQFDLFGLIPAGLAINSTTY